MKAKYAHLHQQQFFWSLANLQLLPNGDHRQAKKLEQMLK
jgi:hypothetical protein